MSNYRFDVNIYPALCFESKMGRDKYWIYGMMGGGINVNQRHYLKYPKYDLLRHTSRIRFSPCTINLWGSTNLRPFDWNGPSSGYSPGCETNQN